jgi:predicted permease
MNLFLYQLKQAYLSLKQKPGFVFSVISTMGITLGALLCTVTLNYLLLVEPLPYPKQDRLFVVDHKIIDANKETKTVAYSYPNLEHLYQNKEDFEQAAMVYYDQDVIISHESQPLVNTTYVTPEFHQMLASPLAVGRMFEASEALDSYNPVALVSYDTWQGEFAGSMSIIDQKITLSDVSYRIVGVLAKDFAEPALAEIGRKTQIWLPWDLNPENADERKNFGNIKNNFKFIGKLATSTTQHQVEKKLTPLLSEYWQEGFSAKYDFFKGWSVTIKARPLKEYILGDSESIALMLLAGVIGLVLIASTNIANLFMSRTAEKQHQIAIHAALGANKKHAFKAVFAETILLMFMSIILSLVVAQVGFSLMHQYLVDILPRINELSLNIITLGSAILTTLFFAFAFAKLSTRIINYKMLNTALQSSGKNSSLQVSTKTRYILIASQVALATTLAFANISLFKSAMETVYTPIGFTTNNISTLILNFSSTEVTSEEEKNNSMTELMRRLEALPQVESISQGSSPLDGFGVKALTKQSDNVKYIPYFKRIDQKYFSLIEQPLLAGENITKDDRRDNNNVMIINQAFAMQLKVDGDVIGMKLSSIGEPDFKIIGIVQDIFIPGQTAFGNDDVMAAVPRSYAPISLYTQQFMLKIKTDKFISRQQLGKILAESDSRYSVLNFHRTSDLLTKSLFPKISIAVTTAILASLVLILAGIGLYGILSYSTQMRQFEIGTRMALGAKRKDIILMVLKDNITALFIGISLSMTVLLGVYLILDERLISYKAVELITLYFITIGFISLISFLACYLPLQKSIKQPVIHSLRGAE